MDCLFIVLYVILMFLLFVIWAVTRIKRTSNLDSMFLDLLKANPNTKAFCLGRDKNSDKFKNVYLNDEEKAYIKLETFPIGTDGNYKFTKEHGTINDQRDGFKVTGLDFVTFNCPIGFEGPTCELIPLCGENDDNKIKPLTYTQFNTLNLFRNTFEKTTKSGSYAALAEPTHPRIRVRCLTKGDYELQTCPDNKLLDANLSCKPYDICEDKLSGYKHNYQIDDRVLQRNDFYICRSNKSEKYTCANNTVFSKASSGCITESVCFDKSSAQLAVDSHNYIQCGNDVGKRVHCNEGVVEKDGVLSCKISTCQPRILSFDNGTLFYQYGVITCVDDKPQRKVCDNSRSNTPKTYKYKWAEDFQYSLSEWPREVMVNNNCVTPTDDIIENPIVDLQWSNAMANAYPFNLKTQQYVCDEKTKYRWDYIDGVTVPQNLDLFIDPGAPCQTKGYSVDELPWGNFKTRKFPSSSNLAPIVIGTRVGSNVDNKKMWPWYDEATKKYSSQNYSYKYSDRCVILMTTQSDTPPLGFNGRTSSGLLELFGYQEMPYKFANKYMWYVISSGQFKPIEYAPNSKFEISCIYGCPKILKTDRDTETFILWNNIKEGEEIRLSNTEISLTRKGVKIGNKFEDAGFIPIIIEADRVSAIFRYGNIESSIPNTEEFIMP